MSEQTTPGDDIRPEGEVEPRISDPHGVIEDSSFPRSYKEYRITAPFMVYAHSEEQAWKRWEFFVEVLSQLAVNSWHSHELVEFVVPALVDRPDPTIEFIKEHWVESADDLRESMVSGLLPEWALLNPDHDKDWDPGRLAYRIFHGQLEPGDEGDSLY